MDFLNTAFAQVTDLFKSMTPGARITAGLLLLIVVISLGYLFTMQVSGPDEFLMGGEHFAPGQLQAMEAAWGKAGLSDYEIVGTQVRVPNSQKGKYMGALLEGKALPPTWGGALDEAMANTSMLPMDKQEREMRFRIGKQKDLALCIEGMSGIAKASVIYDTLDKRGLNPERITTATVNIKTLDSQPLSEERISSIRFAVASAMAGMKPEDVTVFDVSTGRSVSGHSAGSANPIDDPYLARKRAYEQEWKEKAEKILAYIPGVNVEFNVELDREKSTVETVRKLDPKTVPLFTKESTGDSSSQGESPGGAPGFQAQQPNRAAALAVTQSAGNREEQSQTQAETQNAVSGTQRNIEMVGLTPKRVTVAVSVPASYFAKVWRERNPAAAGAEAKPPEQAALEQIRTAEEAKIKNHIAQLLPQTDGVTDLTSLVAVTAFQDITPAAIPEPGFGPTALGWLAESWSTLALAGLALFSLLMVRSMVRPTRTTEVARPKSAAPALVAESESESQAAKPINRLGRFSGTGRSLRDDLAELVHEDPDAAANILRTWIGSSTSKT